MKTQTAQLATEGAGVRILRAIGTTRLRHLDPFLMLDHFDTDEPQDYLAGFPDHPHRGFVTLTYMLDGQMEHRDSMGNQGVLTPGAAQWMKAASGVIHSEMPQQIDGRMRGFQFWINLPAEHKMDAPQYQEYGAQALPNVAIDGLGAKLVVGEIADMKSPIQDPLTQTLVADVVVAPGQAGQIELPVDHRHFVFVYEGQDLIANGNLLPSKTLAYDFDHQLSLRSASGAKLIVASAKPIREPIVQYGPFVMNSRAGIEQAINDYQHGQLVASA